MSEPCYKTNIDKLSKISSTTNGFEIYRNTIDSVLESGYEHLIDESVGKVGLGTVKDTVKVLALVGVMAVMYKQSDWFQKAYKRFFK